MCSNSTNWNNLPPHVLMSQLFSTCFLNPLALELLQIMAQSTGTFFFSRACLNQLLALQILPQSFHRKRKASDAETNEKKSRNRESPNWCKLIECLAEMINTGEYVTSLGLSITMSRALSVTILLQLLKIRWQWKLEPHHHGSQSYSIVTVTALIIIVFLSIAQVSD